jgi:hypothetical protein
LLRKTILAPRGTVSTGDWNVTTMTKTLAAPLGDPPPPPPQESMLKAGLANARIRIERSEVFRSKTTKRMKDMVFSKLSTLHSNDSSNDKTKQESTTTNTSTFSDPTTSRDSKTSFQSSKVQTNITDLFNKKKILKHPPSSDIHSTTDPISKTTQETNVPTGEPSLEATPMDIEPTKEDLPTQMMKHVQQEKLDTSQTNHATSNFEKENDNPSVDHPPPNPVKIPSLPNGFTTATQHFLDQITHGTSHEIIEERLKFEVPTDKNEIDDSMIHTKALVILGRLVNEDPSRKVVAFKHADEKYWKPLEKTHDIPQTMESMRKYIADPNFNSRTKRLTFHMRFLTAKPLRMMKKNSLFMSWLKKERIWLSMNQIATTNNKRVGFFIGKNAYITNLAAFQSFVVKILKSNHSQVPDFQISVDGVGDTKDSTRSKALILICAAEDISILRESLLTSFSLNSAFPFIPFKAMHHLSPEIQRAYYHRQRQETHGADLVEIPLPNFDGLDLPSNHPSLMSLQEYAFTMTKDKIPIRLDIDNGTKSQDTVFRVHSSQKELAKEKISKWLEQYMDVKISWSPNQEYGSSVFNLDNASKIMANQFEAAGKDYLANFPALSISDQSSKSTTKENAWHSKERKTKGLPTTIHEDSNTVATTVSSFTNSSSVINDLQTLRQNIRKVAFSHKRLEASIIENFMDDEENELNLRASFNNYKEGVERLEVAQQRQCAINFTSCQTHTRPRDEFPRWYG